MCIVTFFLRSVKQANTSASALDAQFFLRSSGLCDIIRFSSPISMDHMPIRRSTSRSTFGETLIVVSVVAGFFVALMKDKVSLQNISLTTFLVSMVVFYIASSFAECCSSG